MQKKRTQQLQSFCSWLGIEMQDLSLLDMALTHTSYAHEAKAMPKPQHNERIEFLDGLLNQLEPLVDKYFRDNNIGIYKKN